MDGLSRESRTLLQGYVAARTPTVDALERAWSDVQERIAAGPPAMSMDAPASNVRMVPVRIVVVAVAVAAALVLAWQLVPRTVEQGEDPSGVQAPLVAPATDSGDAHSATLREASSTVENEVSEPSAEPQASEAEATARVEKPLRSGGAKGETREVKPRGAQGLKEETAILRDGETALAAGDPKRALAAFDRHAREFPKGQLVPERMFKRAVALCEVGRTKAATKAVEAFLRAYPASPLRSRVEDVCAVK